MPSNGTVQLSIVTTIIEGNKQWLQFIRAKHPSPRHNIYTKHTFILLHAVQHKLKYIYWDEICCEGQCNNLHGTRIFPLAFEKELLSLRIHMVRQTLQGPRLKLNYEDDHVDTITLKRQEGGRVQMIMQVYNL